MRIHSASGDDDLRFHDLLVHQEFNWSFNMNFQGTTLFFCHFWWANKDKSFEVFNRDIGTNYCSTNCYWFVKEDGFYFIDDINKVFPIPKLQNWWLKFNGRCKKNNYSMFFAPIISCSYVNKNKMHVFLSFFHFSIFLIHLYLGWF